MPRQPLDDLSFHEAELSEARLNAGREILRLMDDLGFGMQAAAWLYFEEPGEWRLYFISSMYDEMGPRWIYDRLLKAFQKRQLPDGITPLDIYLASPRDLLALALSRRVPV